MMYDEFQEKVKDYANGAKPRECSVGDYDLIEKVYAYHPLISPINGKRQVAMLWQEFGLDIFLELYPVTDRAMKYEENINKKRRDLEALMNEYNKWVEKHRG